VPITNPERPKNTVRVQFYAAFFERYLLLFVVVVVFFFRFEYIREHTLATNTIPNAVFIVRSYIAREVDSCVFSRKNRRNFYALKLPQRRGHDNSFSANQLRSDEVDV